MEDKVRVRMQALNHSLHFLRNLVGIMKMGSNNCQKAFSQGAIEAYSVIYLDVYLISWKQIASATAATKHLFWNSPSSKLLKDRTIYLEERGELGGTGFVRIHAPAFFLALNGVLTVV